VDILLHDFILLAKFAKNLMHAKNKRFSAFSLNCYLNAHTCYWNRVKYSHSLGIVICGP